MKNLLMSLTLLTALSGSYVAQADDLVVVATVKVQAGTETEFRKAALDILAPTRQEPGNISYEFYQSPNDPTAFTTVEHWRSQEAIDIHMKTSFMQKFFGIVGPFFAPGYPVLTNYQSIENK